MRIGIGRKTRGDLPWQDVMARGVEITHDREIYVKVPRCQTKVTKLFATYRGGFSGLARPDCVLLQRPSIGSEELFVNKFGIFNRPPWGRIASCQGRLKTCSTSLRVEMAKLFRNSS